MNHCTHGPTRHLVPGSICSFCRQPVRADEIVAAVPQQQATRGEVAGGVGHAPEAAPRTFVPEVSATGNGAACPPLTVQRLGHTIAASAPTPAATSPHGLDCGIPSANAQHGADAALSLLDLIDATPRARITDPDTAHQAATFRSGRLTADMRVVLAAHVAAGERGLTGPELATATRRTYEQIGPRRKPLEVAGMVEKAERRPKDPTQPGGSLVWAYRITDLGRATYAREQARTAA